MIHEGILFVTGTGTGVGKTIVTAAVAALASEAGQRVAVVKLAQTGVQPGQHSGPGSDIPDLETITRLSGVTDVHELARFPDPLSPEAAARVSGLPEVDFARARGLIEGAGGLLVRYDSGGATLADLAVALSEQGLDAPALIVTAAGLGTLNHTALTLEAAAARKVTVAGVVIGSWPRDPGLAERENLIDLEILIGGPLAGVLPEGSSALGAREFRAVARAGLAPSLGGSRVCN